MFLGIHWYFTRVNVRTFLIYLKTWILEQNKSSNIDDTKLRDVKNSKRDQLIAQDINTSQNSHTNGTWNLSQRNVRPYFLEEVIERYNTEHFPKSVHECHLQFISPYWNIIWVLLHAELLHLLKYWKMDCAIVQKYCAIFNKYLIWSNQWVEGGWAKDISQNFCNDILRLNGMISSNLNYLPFCKECLQSLGYFPVEVH